LEPLRDQDLRWALPVLLATPGSGRGAAAAVRAFEDYLGDPRIGWEGLRQGDADRPSALFFAILLPGSTAIVLTPSPDELGIEAAAQEELTRAGLAQLGERRLYFAQALIIPEAVGQKRVLESVGFRRLAPLTYLERDVRYPWIEPPALEEGAWLTFSRQTYGEFAALLLETYKESADCPELTRLRPIEDVIAGHQAAGEFDPLLWEILRVDSQNAGCILLAPLRDGRTVELAYVGVAPALRGRGIAALLLRRAMAQCRARGARRLTLAVDDRNEVAKRVYARCGFQASTHRDAYLYRWDATAERNES
jgi:mycothiol synthase